MKEESLSSWCRSALSKSCQRVATGAMKVSKGGASPLRLMNTASSHVAQRTGFRPCFAFSKPSQVFLSVPPIIGVDRSEPSRS